VEITECRVVRRFCERCEKEPEGDRPAWIVEGDLTRVRRPECGNGLRMNPQSNPAAEADMCQTRKRCD